MRGAHRTVLHPAANPERAIECANYMDYSMRGSLLVCDREACVSQGLAVPGGTKATRTMSLTLLRRWIEF